MQIQEGKQANLIQKSSSTQNKKALIIKSFPLHNKDELMAYNIYIEQIGDGIQKSKIMRYPCIRQGCMTTCYFDIKSNALINIEKIGFCLNCGNQNSRIYLDIGYKVFLEKHHKYITLNQPFNVQINPIKKEHLFPPHSLTNHISTQLSSYISYKLFQDLRLKQAPINYQIIDFDRVRKDLSILIAPKQQNKNYFLYSFCKYYHQPYQEQNYLYIIIWLHGEEQALKVRILKENNEQMCEVTDYLSFGMVNFMVNLNTLVFAIPKNGGTEYFVSKVDHHFFKEQMVLRVVQMEAWKDPQSRLYASLLVDQNINSIFVIGGIDKFKNDSLEYISCFTKCRWETTDKLQLKAEIQKNHKLFASQSFSSSNYLSSGNKGQSSENKFAFIKNIFMIYYYNRNSIMDEKNKFLQGAKPLKKQFFSIGGAVKDPTYTSNRLKNEKPGIRSITYDTTSKQNPIIYEISNNIAFCGNSYFSFQIPYNPTISKRKFKSNIIVFGGHRAEGSMADFRNKNGEKQDPYKQDPHFGNIYLVDMTDIKYSKIIDEKFRYSHLLPHNLDQFSILLQDQKNKYFVRATLPLQKPVQMKDGFIHYIVLQFWLETTMFYFIPILSPRVENSQINV